jgi:hypothetical protein
MRIRAAFVADVKLKESTIKDDILKSDYTHLQRDALIAYRLRSFSLLSQC